ncbi:MAG: DUF2161 family putative PD-(D/E)XK-type phosphodiesterase [Patescibacteria group bacterium]
MALCSETALYAPVKALLASQGYEVRGEVRGCDLVAVRGDEMVVVELKPAMNLTLVLQGVDRLKLTDAVYLAVAAPRRRSRRFPHEAVQLCRRLGLGLILVHLARVPRAEVVCDPGPYHPRPAYRERRLLLLEYRRRTGDHNTGGGNRRPVVTAYREEALRLACELERRAEAKVKDLREATGNEKAGQVLLRNVYGWFERAGRGVYRLTPRGRAALNEYAEVIAGWRTFQEGGEGCSQNELTK